MSSDLEFRIVDLLEVMMKYFPRDRDCIALFEVCKAARV